MNLSGNAILRELSVMFSVGVAASKLNPTTSTIWENIETGKKILEFIGDIPEWANYERDLEDNLSSLKRKNQHLCSKKEDVLEEVKILEFQTSGKRKREVSNWVRNVRRKGQDVHIIEQEMQRKKHLSRFLFRAWLGKCVKKEEEEVDELIRQGDALGLGSGLVMEANNGTIQQQLVASPLVGESSKTRLQIWSTLIQAAVRRPGYARTLGILGEEGIGKTTMMVNIYNLEVAYSGLFKHAFYVNVREDIDLFHLQAAIGEEMKLRDLTDMTDERKRAARIKAALQSRGRFLLILDGLSQRFPLNDIGIPLEDDGGKLVVVSREICQACDKFIRLERLPDKDSEELFMKTLRPTFRSSAPLSPEIEDIAKKIIRQCRGLPSEIVDTAESLRGVDDIYEWRTRWRMLQAP